MVLSGRIGFPKITPVQPKNRYRSGVHLRWTTVTYRSVAGALLTIAVIAGFILYLLFPQPMRVGADKVGELFRRGLERIGGASPGTADLGAQTAKFIAIDGTVRVKKANSNNWVTAQFGLMLERGDVVQTSSEGMAKVVFADGTNYTVKPDSLIVIEENSTNAAQQTQVAVQLTTGTVDLATGTYVPGSKSQVHVSGATASLAPDTAAMVRNDPRADQHEVMVTRGSAQVTRGKETQNVTEYEKVSFKNDSATMTKAKELAPPTLIEPANMSPIFAAGPAPVGFSWTPVDTAWAYRLRVSRNPYFTSLVVDRKLTDTEIKITGLQQGAYYWMVQAVDSGGKQSVESEHNRFTIIPKGVENVIVQLELEPLLQHGHVVEIKGRTESSAKVTVNGQEVPDVKPDGSFSYFTSPLPYGENVITITAQNTRGGVKTKQQKIVIQ